MNPWAAEGEHVIHLPQGAQLLTDCKTKLMRTSELCCAACCLKMLLLVWRHSCGSFVFHQGFMLFLDVCIYMCQGRAFRTIRVSFFLAGCCFVGWLGEGLLIFLKRWLSRRGGETTAVGWPFPQQAHATIQAWACCGILVKRFIRIELSLTIKVVFFHKLQHKALFCIHNLINTRALACASFVFNYLKVSLRHASDGVIHWCTSRSVRANE